MKTSLALLAQSHDRNLREQPAYWAFKQRVRDATLSTTSVTLENLANLARQVFYQDGGVAQLLKNHVSLCHFSKINKFVHAHGAEAFADAQAKLEQRVDKSLQQVVHTTGKPLRRTRSPSEERNFLESEFALHDDAIPVYSQMNIGLASSGARDIDRLSLYDELDVADILDALAIPTRVASDTPDFDAFWVDTPPIPLGWPFADILLEALPFRYPELLLDIPQYGIDDSLDEDPVGFLAAHYKECQKALGLSSLRDARLHARRGLPAALRPQLWDLMIQTDLVEDFPRSTVEYCSKLKADVAKNDLLLDRILRSDVKQCQNDDTYFVFEDELRTVLWYWSRDPWINNRMRSNQPSVDYAPNGILPVWGVSCYALPICYLRSEPEMIYMTFRELYVRYFSHLHTVAISSTTPTLPVLCHIFEALFKQCDPALFLHMSHTLGLPPVKYARRWIMYGFIGVLDVEQVLLLWDRILGYDDLVILSVAAVTIFSFRAKYLREAKTEQDVQNSLSDLGAIKIVPLLIDLITRGRTSWLTYSCNS